jgi:hypothetical protein
MNKPLAMHMSTKSLLSRENIEMTFTAFATSTGCSDYIRSTAQHMEAAGHTFNYLLKFEPAVIIDGTAYSAAGPTPDRVFITALNFL